MLLTTNPLKQCSLDDINESITEATLFTAFYYPKAQSDAVKLIYGVDKSTRNIFGEDHERAHKSTSNINIAPVINARKKLINKGFLKKMDDNLRGSIFKSSSIPITNYIENKLDSRKSRKIPSPSEDYTALSIILDSNWFRSFFSNDFLLNPPTHQPIRHPDWIIDDENNEIPPQVYHPYGYFTKKRMMENMIHYPKIEVYNVVNLYSYLIEDIGAYSWGILPVLKKSNHFIPVTSKEIIKNGNFDNIIQKYRDDLPNDTIEEFYSYCVEDNNSLDWCAPVNPSRFIEKITIQSTLIPQSVSEIMMRAGRIPLTLMQELQNLQSQIYHID